MSAPKRCSRKKNKIQNKSHKEEKKIKIEKKNDDFNTQTMKSDILYLHTSVMRVCDCVYKRPHLRFVHEWACFLRIHSVLI